jgi:hypothetical protein
MSSLIINKENQEGDYFFKGSKKPPFGAIGICFQLDIFNESNKKCDYLLYSLK